MQFVYAEDTMYNEKERGTYDLKFHSLALEFDSADLEVDSNCADIAFGVGIICKTKQET